MRLLALVIVTLLVTASINRDATLTVSPCRAPNDTSALLGVGLAWQLASFDSTALAVLDLSESPASPVLVTDSLTCANALDAYNSHVASFDSGLVQSTGYVFKAAPIYLVPRDPGLAGHAKVTIALDSTFAFVTSWEDHD